jgi:6-pyruvoyltetrahydropterin/6-carboxytetrahydropterin synthase
MPNPVVTGKPPHHSRLPNVSVAKRVGFCAAHWYYRPDWSDQQNQQTFYACANRHGHGHNYTLWVRIAGECQPNTGMVVNLNQIKHWLQTAVVEPLDHKNLNTQVPYFADRIPTLEHLACYIAQQLQPHIPPDLQLTGFTLTENETLWVDALLNPTTTEITSSSLKPPQQDDAQPMLFLTRRYDFSAAHRLYNPQFTDDQNEAVFGLCNNPNGHGHNYDVELTLTGQPDPDTGMLIDIVALDTLVKQYVIDHVDHKHLNMDVPMFAGINPTAENIAVVFWHVLAPLFSQQQNYKATLHRVRIIESRNNLADYYGPSISITNTLPHLS